MSSMPHPLRFRPADIAGHTLAVSTRRLLSMRAMLESAQEPTHLDAAPDREQHRIEPTARANTCAIGFGILARGLWIDHVVGNDDRAWRQFWREEFQAPDIQILPDVKQHEVEWPGQLLQDLQHVADAKVHEFCQSDSLELVPCIRGFLSDQVGGDDLAPGLARRLREPDRGI